MGIKDGGLLKCGFFFILLCVLYKRMKRIAVLTMARNDDFFLRKWVEYYGRELVKENL